MLLRRSLTAAFTLLLFTQCNSPESSNEASGSKSNFSIGWRDVNAANVEMVDTTSVVDRSIPLNGWLISGTAPKKYIMGMDKGAGRNGGAAATIKSISTIQNDFGTLLQSKVIDSLLGKRVRLSAWIKSDKVARWSGMWMRVDGKGDVGVTAFDNMSRRPIVGTTGWEEYQIVLDVKEDTENIAYGVLLNGEGQIWFDDMRFEIVDDTVPVTNLAHIVGRSNK